MTYQRGGERQPRRQASRTATAMTMLLTVVVAGGVTAWLATSEAADEHVPASGTTDPFPREHGIAACLHIDQPPIADGASLADAMLAHATARDHLFPLPAVSFARSGPADQGVVVALWPNGTDTDAVTTRRAMHSDVACRTEPGGWALSITAASLADGADRLMQRAEFGADWTGRIEVRPDPATTRVRTTLHFSGPLGISGSCWLDERLVIDPESGLPGVVSERGDDAGLAGLVACRRFADELAEGGAGAQAMALFPAELADVAAGPSLHAETVEVTADGVVIRGRAR